MTYQQMVKEDYKNKQKARAKKGIRYRIPMLFAVPAQLVMAWIITQADYTIRTKKGVREYKKADPVFSKQYERKKARRKMARASRRRNRVA